MTITLNLDDILAYNSVHYSGNLNYVKINDCEYSFVKNYLFFTPRMFDNVFYSINKIQSGTYILRDLVFGKIYIGSSENIYRRISKHKLLIGNKKHENKNFNELLKNTSIKDFELIIIFTPNRNIAFEIEQLLVNKYKNSGNLLNIANDVRYAMKGHIFSDEHKRKISQSNKGRLISEEHKHLLSNFQKTNPAAISSRQKLLDNKKRKIKVFGVEYESLTEAGQKSGFSESFLRRNVDNEKCNDVTWLSDNSSPLKGRNLNSELKQKLSEFRKTDPKSIAQLQSIQILKRKSITLNGIFYSSLRDAVKYSGFSSYRIFQELKHVDRTKPYVLNIV